MTSRNKLISHNQTILSFSVAEDEETVVVLSPKVIGDLENRLSDVVDHIQCSMNPMNTIERRRIMLSRSFDMNVYVQPSRMFDAKRLWSAEYKKKIRKNGRNKEQIEICPQKGFADSLKLRRKCYLKMPSVPGQPFVLIYDDDDNEYIPPTITTPSQHILNVERNLPKFSKTLIPHEPNVIGKFRTPCSLKLKIKAKLKIWPPKRLTQSLDCPNQLDHEKYHAPPGAKENYSCRSVTDIKAADRALEAVSIFMKKSRVLPDIPNCSNVQNEGKKIISSPKHMKGDDWETYSLIDTDGEWTKLYPVSSSFFSESDEEKTDSLEPILQKELLEKAVENETCLESQIEEEISCTGKNENTQPSFSQMDNVIIEIINMDMDKPQTVRQVLEESQSVSEWIGENIVTPHRENELDDYLPAPSPTSSGVDYNIGAGHRDKYNSENAVKEVMSFVQLKLRHETTKDFRSKSCCSFGTINPSQKILAQPDLAAVSVSDTYLNVQKKSTLLQKDNEILGKKLHMFNQPPQLSNSIDEVLSLRVTNPVGFCVLRTICSKQLKLYENENYQEHEGTEASFPPVPGSGELSKSRFDQYHHRRKILSTFCQAILFASDQCDEGYLGSEEDEEYKSRMMNDFWPIPSQCTAIRRDSQASSSSLGDDNFATNPKLRKKEGVLIDYDDYEYWSWISGHEQLFSQSHETFANSNMQDNQNLQGLLVRTEIPNNIPNLQTEMPVGCRRCMFKIWKWCLDSLLKSL